MIYEKIYITGHSEIFVSPRSWEELTKGIEAAAIREAEETTLRPSCSSLAIMTTDIIKNYLYKRGIDHYKLLLEG